MRLRIRLGWVASLLVALWLLMPMGAYAQEEIGDQSVFGGTYTLPSGHRLRGDLSVFGGAATIERDAVVDGDIAVFGGSVEVAGTVNGDVALMGGVIYLKETAVIEGDVVSLGGSVRREPGSVVKGSVTTGPEWRGALPFADGLRALPDWLGSRPWREAPEAAARRGDGNPVISLILGLLWSALLTAMLCALALVILAAIPDRAEVMSHAVATVPWLAFLFGLVTLILALGLILFLMITICLLPIALLLGVSLVLALLVGWVTVGVALGNRLMAALQVEQVHPMIAGVVGVALITLISRLPCVGGLLFFLGAATGLGALILTKAGGQPYGTSSVM
ncbi:MAG: hypothetical protein Kow0047_08660 [Anaerolineae bacterium]